MVHGSVPCTREKLLGADLWALETPILASNNSDNNATMMHDKQK